MTRRYSTQLIRTDAIEVTSQGFLRIPVFAGRTGIQTYKRNDGEIIREFRPESEVFSTATLDSLRNAPITNNHPSEMVNVDNSNVLVVGMVGDTIEKIKKGKLLFQKTLANIFGKDTIEDIKNGKVEVSLGYDLQLDMTPGEFEGQRFDAIQRNIKINHLAIVNKARGGKEVKLRLDSGDAIEIDDPNKGNTMKVKIGDKEFDLADDVAGAVNGLIKDNASLQTKADGMKSKEDFEKVETELKDSKESHEKLEAKHDALKADLEKKDSGNDPKMDSDKVSELVRQRIKIEKVGQNILDEKVLDKMDDMSDRDIKEAVIKVDSPDLDLSKKSDVYVDGRFDHVAEKVAKSSKVNNAAGKNINDNRNDAGNESKTDEEKEKERKDALENAWQKPVGKSKSI